MVEVKQQSLRAIEGDGAMAEHGEAQTENVGAFLREARETTGRSVADVEASLRIRAKFLRSIEDGRYEDLPGQTYAVGFIRSYADFLGLETVALLEQFKKESNGAEGQPNLDFPEPSAEGWFPTGKVVAGCAVVAVAVFTSWFYLQTNNSVDVSTVPAPPGFESALTAQAANQRPDDAEVAASEMGGGEPAAPIDVGTIEQTAAASMEPADTQTDAPPVATGDTTSGDGERPLQHSDQVTAPVAAVAAATAPEPQPAETVSEALSPAAVETPVKVIEPPVKVVEAPAVAAEPLALDENELTPTAAITAEAPPQPVAKPTVAAPPPAPAAPDLESLVAALPSIPADDGEANTGDDGRTYGVINQQARVVIGARADSWVQVLDGNQNVLLTRMLRPGDRYLVPNRNDLVMLTGNAGGLIISVDGETVPRIGSDGAILHNVRLDVELLKAGRAVIQ